VGQAKGASQMNPEDVATQYLVDYLSADSTLMGMLEGDIAPEVKWGSSSLRSCESTSSAEPI
jgi:hypothetical protein